MRHDLSRGSCCRGFIATIRGPWSGGFAATLTLVLISVVVRIAVIWESGILHSPPCLGDCYEYDNIALNLVRGRGFGYFFSDAEWKAPYGDARGKYASVIALEGRYRPTLYRPPFYPLIVAAIYKSFGRSFSAVRLANTLAIGFGTLAAAIAARMIAGELAAILVAILLFFDAQAWVYSASLVPDAFTFALFACLVATLLQIRRQPSTTLYASVGVLFGLLTLTRSFFLIPLCLLVMLFLPGNVSSRLRAISVVFLTWATIISPWAVRNILLSSSLLPFGTQGGMSLAAAYSDEMLGADGVWSIAVRDGALRGVPDWSISLENEIAASKIGIARALAWIIHNPLELSRLLVLKLISIFTIGSLPYASSVVLGSLGLAVLARRKSPYSPLLFGVLSIWLTITLTYNDAEGRLLFPSQVGLTILEAVGISAACGCFLRKYHIFQTRTS